MKQEIDPALVKTWAKEVRSVIHDFIEELEDVEYAGESGINLMGYAKQMSASLRAQMQYLEKKAETLAYKG
jgi:hypothetical protein